MRVVRSGLDNIVPPLANDIVKWPLTTLNLDIEDCNGALKAILQASASTLKTLKLHGKWDMPIADIPKFISLRYLDVERTRELQPGVIEHILRNSRLQTLIFNADQREPLTRLADVGPLSSLTTLILTGNWHHNSEYRGPFPYLQTLTRILEQNHQLVTLAIHITTLSPATDVTAIISVIAHFPCLEKLSLPLEYRDDDYPSFQPLSTLPKLKILSLVMRYTKDSRVDKTDTIMVPLRTLSSLVSLEVLHMTDDWLSFSMGTRAYDTLKKILLPLRKLRVVSFQGALSWIPEGFLPGPVPIIGTINREGQVRFPLGGAQQSWGRNIKKRASVVCAMAWANSFPELESISFRSQLPSIIHSFNIKRESGGKHIMRAVPLGAKNAERSTQRRLNEIVSRHFSE
ncbi:hypothetical protein NKR23_g5992 [Pleurostoma richardsiae]|uniref:Uncharacterized protein n=1 Tax=Pleurostoma richardsiae TaxID=41990 RepID=A0AA38RCI5_9PEZI|nr:hypothetical protein NKR23_g5992 [Pleurostoma richardsiae]